MCSTHGVYILGISEEELELQHLIKTVFLPLPCVLQVAALLLQFSKTVSNLSNMFKNRD